MKKITVGLNGGKSMQWQFKSSSHDVLVAINDSKEILHFHDHQVKTIKVGWNGGKSMQRQLKSNSHHVPPIWIGTSFNSPLSLALRSVSRSCGGNPVLNQNAWAISSSDRACLRPSANFSPSIALRNLRASLLQGSDSQWPYPEIPELGCHPTHDGHVPNNPDWYDCTALHTCSWLHMQQPS